MTVEVADETILQVYGFGKVEVDLDQPGTTTKPVKDFRGTGCSPLKQWSNGVNHSSTKSKMKAVLGFPGKESLTFDLARDCFPQQV